MGVSTSACRILDHTTAPESGLLTDTEARLPVFKGFDQDDE